MGSVEGTVAAGSEAVRNLVIAARTGRPVGWSRRAAAAPPSNAARCVAAAFVVLVALSVLPSADAAAQAPERVSRVRVTLRAPVEREAGEAWQRSLIGEVVSASSDSLTITLEPRVGTLTLAPADVRRIELSRGVPGRAASALQRGIGGALWGAVVGSLYNLLIEDDDSVSVGESALQWAGGAGAWGFVTGALAPQEGWRRVRWEDLNAP